MKVPLIGLKVTTGTIALGAIGVMLAPKVIPAVADFLKTATAGAAGLSVGGVSRLGATPAPRTTPIRRPAGRRVVI